MAARFVNIDHDIPLLLLPDLRDWVPADHLVHFIMDAVGPRDLREARVNHTGSGARKTCRRSCSAAVTRSGFVGVCWPC